MTGGNNRRFSGKGPGQGSRVSPLLGGLDPRLRRNQSAGLLDLDIGLGLEVDNATGRLNVQLGPGLEFDNEGALVAEIRSRNLPGQGPVFVDENGDIVINVGGGLLISVGRVVVQQRTITTRTEFLGFVPGQTQTTQLNGNIIGITTSGLTTLHYAWALPPDLNRSVDPVLTLPMFKTSGASATATYDVEVYSLGAGDDPTSTTPTEDITGETSVVSTDDSLVLAETTMTAATVLGASKRIMYVRIPFSSVTGPTVVYIQSPYITFGVDSDSLNGSA